MTEGDYLRTLDNEKLAGYLSGVLAAHSQGLLEGIVDIDLNQEAQELYPGILGILNSPYGKGGET